MKKKMCFTICILLLLAMALPIAGCTTREDSLKRQAEAITAEIFSTEKDFPEFRYYQVEDILNSITNQQEGATRTAADYTLTVSVPNFSTIQVKDISISNLPSTDINAPNPAAYYEAYIVQAEKALQDFLSGSKSNINYVDKTFRCSLNRENNQWIVSINRNDIEKISTATKNDIKETAKAFAEKDDMYEMLLAAEMVKGDMLSLFPSSEFLLSSKVESLEPDSDDRYTVRVSYPNPATVFEKAAQNFFNNYAAAGEKSFWEFDTSDIFLDIAPVLEEDIDYTSESFTVYKDGSFGEDFYALKDTIQSYYDEQSNAVVSRLNAEFVIREIEKPATGVLSGDSSGENLLINTSADFDDIHLTFYRISGTDIYAEEGTLALSVYIHAGDTPTIRLPVGNYKMIEGSGTKWYGEEYSFGPDGHYELADMLIDIEYNYNYTLTLYGVEDGNLPTQVIPFPYD